MKSRRPPPNRPEVAPALAPPPPARVPSPVPLPVEGTSRSRRWLLTGGAVLVVLLAAGAGVWWWKREKPPEPPLPAGITDTEVAEALAKSRALVQADPTSADAWGNYGTVLLANLFDRDADICFVQAAKLDPKEPRWPYARGQIALKRDPPGALALLTAAADAAADRPEFRLAFTLALAEAVLESGDVDRAAGLYRAELAKSPRQERASYGLGLVARARGDDADAALRFEAARHHPACRKQATAQLAVLARARGDVATAKQLAAEADALDPDPPWPDPYLDRVVALQVGVRGLQRRVGMLERDGNYAAAADAFLAQLRTSRTSKALTGAGVNLARLQKYDEALALLREAVQLDPADSNAHYTLALVLFTQAEKAADADPTSADPPRAYREVVAEAKRATELKPDHALAYMFWGLALNNLGDPKAALDPLRKGLGIRPEQFDLHLGLGRALAKTGDRAGAEASLATAQKLRPDDPRPAQELAKLAGGR